MRLRNTWNLMCLLALVAACSATPKTSEGDCPGDRDSLGDTRFCIVRAPIQETGFDCPASEQFGHAYENMVVCSNAEMLGLDEHEFLRDEHGAQPCAADSSSRLCDDDTGWTVWEQACIAATIVEPEDPSIVVDFSTFTDPLILQASADAGVEIAEYDWQIVEAPLGSSPTLDPNDAEAQFVWDRLGTYRIELNVVDDEGTSSCEPAAVEIEVVADARIYVVLSWSTDDQGTADLDLHYLHPSGSWGDARWDMHAGNATPDWGSDNDPLFVPGESEEELFEHALHHLPTDGQYSIGVRHVGEPGPATDAMLQIFVDGQLVHEQEKASLQPGQFWDVGAIGWPDGDFTVVDDVRE